jgi:hypothetical protein
MTARRRDAAKVGTFARRVEARKRGPFRGSDRADTHKAGDDTLMSASTVASPQAGASQGGTGFPLGCDPADAHGPASDAPWPAPLSHPHTWGPCSELRRPLLHAPARAATRGDGTSFRARRCCSLLVWTGQTSSLAPSRSSKIVSIAHVNDYEIGSRQGSHR